jgi:hypothetical protein
MAKQRVEIEVDVPDGFEFTGEYRCITGGEWGLHAYEPKAFRCEFSEPSTTRFLILRKVEPVRESKYAPLYFHSKGSFWVGEIVSSREHAIASAMSCSSELVTILRLEFENARPVSATVEGVK